MPGLFLSLCVLGGRPALRLPGSLIMHVHRASRAGALRENLNPFELCPRSRVYARVK